MTCLLPLLLVFMPSANSREPIILPANDAVKAAVAAGRPDLLIVKEAWLDGGANRMCQQQSKTQCATKVYVDGTDTSRVAYICEEVTVAFNNTRAK